MPQHLEAGDNSQEERMYGDRQTGVVMVMGGLGSSQAVDFWPTRKYSVASFQQRWSGA